MTAAEYRQATETFRETRELFYRTRLQRGERLSLAETHWLFEQDMGRITLNIRIGMNEAVKAIADFAQAVRELKATTTSFPTGGDTVRR